MLIPGIVLSFVGVGFFCWLLFTLAVYALPFFTGLTAALAAFHVGSGVIGALVIGVLAGGATLAIGQIAFATAPTPLIRAAIALLYAAPAAIAGYHAALGLALIAVPSEGWRDAFAVVGAIPRPRHGFCPHVFVRPADGRAARCRPGSVAASGASGQQGVSSRRHRRSVGYRGHDRSSTRMRTSPHLERSGRSAPLTPPRRVPAAGSWLLRRLQPIGRHHFYPPPFPFLRLESRTSYARCSTSATS